MISRGLMIGTSDQETGATRGHLRPSRHQGTQPLVTLLGLSVIIIIISLASMPLRNMQYHVIQYNMIPLYRRAVSPINGNFFSTNSSYSSQPSTWTPHTSPCPPCIFHVPRISPPHTPRLLNIALSTIPGSSLHDH